jgi:cell wall assembly regulator SMI1
MTVPITSSLRSISGALERLQRTETIGLLRPGLPPPVLAGELAALQLRSTADLAALYAWHDGTDATSAGRLGDLYLLPGFYFLSINDALISRRTAIADPRWNPSWLPIMAGSDADFVAVQCDARERDWGTVVRLRHPQVMFPSVSALFATVAAAYDTGVYYVDDDGRLELDGQAFVALARSLDGDVACRRR